MSLKHDLFGGRQVTNIKSKNKGSVNERQVCKVLTLWTGAPFVRTPGSGAFRWQSTDKIAGDVTCDDKDFYFPFSVETKHLSSVSVASKLRTGSGIYKIMEQCMFDADRSNRLPLMLLRPNGMKTWKEGRFKFQNYYLVFLYRFGGKFVWKDKDIKPLFAGKCEQRGFDIVGFDLREVIGKVTFKELTAFIQEHGKVEQFNRDKRLRYTWSY